MARTWSQITKEPHGSAAWLKQRWSLPTGERLVSASVAGAIYDVHPFVSPAELAAELLADNPPEPRDQNEAMERGNRLEPVLMQWANDRLGTEFKTPDVLYMFQDGPARMIATLDGFDGQQILEVKTTTRQFTGVLPDYWRVQGIQQAICADVSTVQWAIFDQSQTLSIHEQYVSSDEKEEHVRAVAKWLTNIDLGITPDGVSWTYATISKRHPNDVAEVVELGPKGAELVAQLKHVKSELRSYQEMEDRLKAELCDLIGDARNATFGGELLATWTTQSRRSLDQKALKEAHPGIVDTYTRETSTRVLRLKGAN